MVDFIDSGFLTEIFTQAFNLRYIQYLNTYYVPILDEMRYALRSKTSQVPAVVTLTETLRDTYSPAGQGTCMCQQPGSLPDSHTIYCSQKRKPSLKYIKGSKINNLATVKVYSRIKLPKRSC